MIPNQPNRSFAEAVLSQVYNNTPSGRRERIIEVSKWLTRQVGLNTYDHSVVLTVLRRRGLTDALIVDHVLPAVVRSLGEDWSNDARSFAQVSLASSRIVELIKDLSKSEDVLNTQNQAGALLVVHEDEQHSIGLRIVADQFLRAGVSVKFLPSASDQKIAKLAGSGDFSYILFSCSNQHALRSIVKSAKRIRRFVEPECKIVLGGFIVELNDVNIPLDVFDIVTNDVRAVVDFAKPVAQTKMKRREQFNE